MDWLCSEFLAVVREGEGLLARPKGKEGGVSVLAM